MITSRTLNQALLFAASLTCALSAHAANDAVACTMEAKMCPDGVTYVGRQGPNCEFAACPSSFSDVPSNHPNADAIIYVQAEGIVSGYSDGSFRPDQKINRAEFAKILEESIPDAEEGVGLCFSAEDFTTFSDVHSEWFWIYACMQSGRGIVEGYPDGTFRPATNINFVEAAKMLYGANHLDKRGILITQPFETNSWYEQHVRYLESQNAIPTSIIRFDQPITRGEMAEMIYRLKAGVTDKPSQTYELLSASKIDDWKTFNSQYFTLSFDVPPGFEVSDEQDVIFVSKGPFVSDYNTNNAFLSIARYNEYNDRNNAIYSARALLSNQVESMITIDGSQFLTIQGDDNPILEGGTSGKIIKIFFPKSVLSIHEKLSNEKLDFSVLPIANKIISTIRFSSTAQ